MVIAPEDVPADHAGLLLAAGVVGAVERLVAFDQTTRNLLQAALSL